MACTSKRGAALIDIDEVMRGVKRSAYNGGGIVIFLLALFFLFGIFSGRAAALHVYNTVGETAAAYLESFIDYRSSGSGYKTAEIFFAYLRYPAFAFLLGFTAFGSALIPITLFLEAFALSFTVNLFTLSFAQYGVLLALLTVGFRCLVVLPCLFYVSVFSLRRSLVRAGMLGRDGRERSKVAASAVCALIICAGAAAESAAIPTLLSGLSAYFT